MSSLSTLIFRNKLVESHHSIKCYIGSLNGDTLFSTENTNNLIYPRSSIKIFQGIPFSYSQAINFYKLNVVFDKTINFNLDPKNYNIGLSWSGNSKYFLDQYEILDKHKNCYVLKND